MTRLVLALAPRWYIWKQTSPEPKSTMATHPRFLTTSTTLTVHVTVKAAKHLLPKFPAIWHPAVMRTTPAPRNVRSRAGRWVHLVTFLYASCLAATFFSLASTSSSTGNASHSFLLFAMVSSM